MGTITRVNNITPPVPPWDDCLSKICIQKTTTNKTAHHTVQLQASKEKIVSLREKYNYDRIIYTDGSASEGLYDGGAGMVVHDVVGGSDRLTRSWCVPTGAHCSSFQAESTALRGSGMADCVGRLGVVSGGDRQPFTYPAHRRRDK